MKKKYSPLAMTLLSVFILLNHIHLFAQKTEDRNDGVTTVEHEVQPFSGLELKGVFNVYIEQGASESVKVIASEELHPHIIVENRNGKLIIDNERPLKLIRNRKLKVYVTVKDLKRLKVTGVGNIMTENTLKVSALELEIGGAGNVELDLDVTDLDIEISSAGNVVLEGTAKKVFIDNRGVGNLNAVNLVSEILELTASGVGSTKVHATEEISIKATGVGNVLYKGNAEVKELDIRGMGRVKKI